RGPDPPGVRRLVGLLPGRQRRLRGRHGGRHDRRPHPRAADSIHGLGRRRNLGRSMFRSPRSMLAAAVAFAAAAAAVWLVAFRTATGMRLDATIMTGFLDLRGPRVDGLADAVAHLADPAPFALATVAIVIVAVLRGRPWLAG